MESEKEKDPSPLYLETFLPWAYRRMGFLPEVVVTKFQTSSPTPSSSRSKPRGKNVKGRDDDIDDSDTRGSYTTRRDPPDKNNNFVNIYTIYDNNDQLIQIKFIKNIEIPRNLLKIIARIVPFHQRLTTISIDKGLQPIIVYEIFKILCVSKITDIILDNTVILEANYYILLDEKCTSLKYLSLARCKLNDEFIESLATKLPDSNLSVLNLSSNRITDVGATYLGDALKSNRKLLYLNLADNMITDIGAESILNSLIEFPLTSEEVYAKKSKYTAYLRQKSDLIKSFIRAPVGDLDKKVAKKKPIKPTTPTPKKKAIEGDPSLKVLQSSLTKFDLLTSDMAEANAETLLGPFNNPFKAEDTVIRDGITYCLGNNILCYLSLAYNNLTYFSVKKLYNVLCTQKLSARYPKGLINVCIEGNRIPKTCMELTEIDVIINSGLAFTRKLSSAGKKSTKKSAGSRQ